jgi:hypothetical protein
VAAGKKLFLVTNSPYHFVWVTVNILLVWMLWVYFHSCYAIFIFCDLIF